MRIKTQFPRQVREIEHVWIPLADGTRLAARIWLPVDAEQRPVPAILEYLPYRKNDGTAARDALRHPYFAGHGYASVRVDMRGSGDSGGILVDEYLPQEQTDALEVLAWLADQPWCTGEAGLLGISWGGFNGLQIAARRPPQLKAVITLCSTDDRYADDVHYMGGCVLGVEALPWASTMLAINALPPDPRYLGEDWRAMWLSRMERTPPFIEAWLSHQRRDAFWKQGSVCEDYAAITCAVFAVGGWADAYTNAVPRLLAGLACPRKGLIGPWAHNYPEVGVPGPAIGFLQECLRWWDFWLKGEATGVMDEPDLRVWMPDGYPLRTGYAERPGRWVAEPAWPSPNITPASLCLNADGALAAAARAEAPLFIEGRQSTGLAAGVWCPYGVDGDFPSDQHAEDRQSLCFTSAPAPAPVEILGFPEVTLTLSADKPLALVAVRLCDVSPAGASTLITRGLLNLTHRDSHEHPAPLEPGRRHTITLRLNAAAYALPAGHRWRVAVSPTYWPHAWPSPEPVTLTIYAGEASRLALPIRPRQDQDSALKPFGPPETAAPLPVEILREKSREVALSFDVAEQTHTLAYRSDSGLSRHLADGLEHEAHSADIFTLAEHDPLSARVRCERRYAVGRGEWRVRVETLSAMTADAERFHVTNSLEAYEGEARVFVKHWTFTVPRDLV